MRMFDIKPLIAFAAVLLVAGFAVACDSSDSAAPADEGAESAGTGIDNGGITEVSDDPDLIAEGEELFSAKGCQACHKMDSDVVGPALKGVTDRREASWLAQMIMHPEEMVKKDPEAKALLEEYGTPMTNQGITADEAEAIIAYLGTQK